jgi:hypothetical protein
MPGTLRNGRVVPPLRATILKTAQIPGYGISMEILGFNALSVTGT